MFLIFSIIAFISIIFLFKVDKRKLRSLGVIFSALTLTFLVACSEADGSIAQSESKDGDVSEIESLEVENLETEEVSKEESKEISQNSDETSSGDVAQNKSSEVLPKMEVHFIDVGQADAILIKSKGNNILIDAGDWRGSEVTEYLKSQGVRELSLLVGTHPHSDHIGQMDKVLEQVKTKEVWMSGGTNTSKVFERVLQAIKSSGANYNEPKAGESYTIGNSKIKVLSPYKIYGDLNNDSIVMKLTYGDISFLFTGDAEDKAELGMLNAKEDLNATILKAGHHGSKTSTTANFYNAVNPEAVVISVGEKNNYGHPHQQTLDLINSSNADLYATKSHGTVVVKTDGVSYSISSSKNRTASSGSSKKAKDPVIASKP